MTTKRIAILGAGASGLAAALRFKHTNYDCEIVMLEKDSEPGGLARSFIVAGSPADLGPHRIFTLLPEIKQFYDEFLGDSLFVVPRKSQMFFKGTFLNYPFKLSEALKSLGISRTWRYGFSAMMSSFKSTPDSPEKNSFDNVMKKAFGSAVYEELLRPFAEKTWKISPSLIDGEVGRVRVSAGGFTKILRQVLHMEKKSDPSALPEFHYLKGGFQEVVDKFVNALQDAPVSIRTQSRIRSILPYKDGSVRIVWDEPAQSGIEAVFDFCFSTIPLNDLILMLIQNVVDARAQKIAQNMRFISTILFFVVVNKDSITSNTWLYFPEKHLIFNRGYETGNFNIHHPQSGKAVLCLEVTAYENDELWKRTDFELADKVQTDICSTGLISPNDISEIRVERIGHAYPLLIKGYKNDLEFLWKYLSQFSSVLTLGRQGLFQHNNMDHSIYTAFSAVDLFMRSTSPVRDWYSSEINKFNDFRIID